MDTRRFGDLGLFSSFIFNYFPDRLANIIASQMNQMKGSDRKMWLEVWEEKAVTLCSAGSYQIRFIPSCRSLSSSATGTDSSGSFSKEQRESSAHASGEGSQLTSPTRLLNAFTTSSLVPASSLPHPPQLQLQKELFSSGIPTSAHLLDQIVCNFKAFTSSTQYCGTGTPGTVFTKICLQGPNFALPSYWSLLHPHITSVLIVLSS